MYNTETQPERKNFRPELVSGAGTSSAAARSAARDGIKLSGGGVESREGRSRPGLADATHQKSRATLRDITSAAEGPPQKSSATVNQ